MTEDQIKILDKALDDLQQTKDELFNFRLHLRGNLLGYQFQLFQSLATIILAFWAIVIATNLITINLFSITSAIISIILIFYNISFVKEVIDSEDKSINQAVKDTDNMGKEVVAKNIESRSKKDFNIWLNYISEQVRKKETEHLSYAPEITLFLFVSSLLFSISGIVYSYLSSYPNYQIFIFIISTSILISVPNWSLKLTNSISRIFNTKLK